MRNLESTASRVHHHALKTAVTHQDVAAPAEDEKRQPELDGEVRYFAELLHRSGSREIARRSADFEGGVRLQRFRLLQGRDHGASLRGHIG